MLSLKKKFQNYFKSVGYFIFKIFYGEIKNIINPENTKDINIDLVKKDKKFLYKVYKIEDGRLYTDTVNDTAVIKNNKIIEGPSFQFRNIDSQVVNTSIKHNLALLNGTPRIKKIFNGKVLSLLTGGGGNENYWHWLFDVLPRLGICENIIDLEMIDFFLLPNNKKKFQVETLEILGIPFKKQISSIKYRHIVTKNLYVTSHPVVLSNNATNDIQNIPPWILQWLRRKFLNNDLKNEKNYSKKIYLDSSDSKSSIQNLRSIINEKEVKNYLLNKGFKPIKLSDLHFKDQVFTFNGANTIVGLHGAGFANITFCNPKTKIIELKANPLDNVIKNLAEKNNLTHRSINSSLNEVEKYNQFGHVKVSIKQLEEFIEN